MEFHTLLSLTGMAWLMHQILSSRKVENANLPSNDADTQSKVWLIHQILFYTQEENVKLKEAGATD